MTYDYRNGIHAKKVFVSFIDAVRDGSSIALTNSQFTGNDMTLFWGAYYGDLTANSVAYYLKDLGFDSTGATQTFGSAEYDTIASVSTSVVTLTTNTSMTVDAHIGKYVIIKKASGKKIFARITDNDASTLTLDSDVSGYGVASSDTIVLLKVPFGLTMTAFQRLDHIANNFSLTLPKNETEDTYFLGTEDSAGSQNMIIDTKNPTKLTGSITVRSGMDLYKLRYGTDSTVPTNTLRYNLGSDYSGYVGLTAIWTTNIGDTDNSDAITYKVVCNDITITTIGDPSVAADGKMEQTVEFEVKGSSARVETYDAQGYDTDCNI